MNRKVVALLLVVCMVFGVFGFAAAQGVNEARSGAGVQRGSAGGPGYTPEEEEGAPELSAGLNQMRIRHTNMHRHQVLVNGRPLDSDLPPVIIDGRILIPVRAVSVGLKADVDWNSTDKIVTITKGDYVVVILMEEGVIKVYKEGVLTDEFEMDVAPLIVCNRTFVPLRFISEALGINVGWDPQQGIAHIGESDGDDSGCIHECDQNCECTHVCDGDCIKCVHVCDDSCKCTHVCNDDCLVCSHSSQGKQIGHICDENCLVCSHVCDEDCECTHVCGDDCIKCVHVCDDDCECSHVCDDDCL